MNKAFIVFVNDPTNDVLDEVFVVAETLIEAAQAVMDVYPTCHVYSIECRNSPVLIVSKRG